MLTRALMLLVLAITGCSQSGQNTGPYHISSLSEDERLRWEADKREFLQLEDLVIGTGPVAARGRRVTADIEVRYTDGTVVYRGPIISFPGFVILNIRDRRVLSIPAQDGIDLGLNGMAVGGRRRITIDRKLVCSHVAESAPPRAFCNLTTAPKNPIEVYKRTLIVEATLTESCNPVITWQGIYVFGDYLIKLKACREESRPTIDPSAPIWHYYDR
ncbi:MAG: hypothetical protein OEY86_11670 [Nitrospira sp.]|nr:hypothetical protein [Nitrospira sp.]